MAANEELEKALSGAVSKVLAKFKKSGRSRCDRDSDTSDEDCAPTRKLSKAAKKRPEEENEAGPSNSKK